MIRYSTALNSTHKYFMELDLAIVPSTTQKVRHSPLSVHIT